MYFFQLFKYVVQEKTTVISLARALILVPGATNVRAMMDMLEMEKIVKVGCT